MIPPLPRPSIRGNNQSITLASLQSRASSQQQRRRRQARVCKLECKTTINRYCGTVWAASPPGRHRQHRPSLPYGHPGHTDSPRPPARHAYGAWWRSPSTAVGLRDFSFIFILARFMDLHIYSWLPSPLFYTYS